MNVLLQPKICKNARVTNEHISLDFKFQLKIKTTCTSQNKDGFLEIAQIVMGLFTSLSLQLWVFLKDLM